MPKEERFITFNLEEIYQALIIRCKLADIELPEAGAPKHTSLSADKKTVTVLFKNDQQEIKHRFDTAFFVLALVFFCNAKNIPIPKAGTKTLSVQPEKIIMKIEM